MKYLIIICLLFSISTASAHIGLADWSCKTPGNNEINNFVDKPALYLNNGANIPDLNKWYFYKYHIICINNGNDLFIVNEQTNQIDTFNGVGISPEIIDKEHLTPHFLTRWYSADWHTSIINNCLFILVFGFYFAIPAILILVWVFYKAINRKINIRSPYTIVVILITGYLLIDYLLDVFPQSI